MSLSTTLISASPLLLQGAHRADFINAFPRSGRFPQGLKPVLFQNINGTSKFVPFPKPTYETSSRNDGISSYFVKILSYVIDIALGRAASGSL